ncbi:carbon-phosphorus lyase complex subunit PhnI, partial [Acinetobacter baumannii]
SEPLDTADMAIRRRISAAFKDLPGGQVLGPTYDYTHRLLDFALAAGGDPPPAVQAERPVDARMPRVADVLGQEGLIERDPPAEIDGPPADL